MNQTEENQSKESVHDRLYALVRSTEEVRDKINQMKRDRKNRSDET